MLTGLARAQPKGATRVATAVHCTVRCWVVTPLHILACTLGIVPPVRHVYIDNFIYIYIRQKYTASTLRHNKQNSSTRQKHTHARAELFAFSPFVSIGPYCLLPYLEKVMPVGGGGGEGCCTHSAWLKVLNLYAVSSKKKWHFFPFSKHKWDHARLSAQTSSTCYTGGKVQFVAD